MHTVSIPPQEHPMRHAEYRILYRPKPDRWPRWMWKLWTWL